MRTNGRGATHFNLWLGPAFDADVLAFDARGFGFGFSDGAPSINGAIADSLPIYDELRKLDQQHRPIVVIGQSMGTASAIHVAANRRADLLVLLSPFSSLEDVLDAYRNQLPWCVDLRVDRSLSELYSSPTSDLQRITAPSLIVRGKGDPLSTESVVGRVSRACNAKVKEVCVVRGVHDDVHPTNSEAGACIERFSKRALPATGSTAATTSLPPPVPLAGGRWPAAAPGICGSSPDRYEGDDRAANPYKNEFTTSSGGCVGFCAGSRADSVGLGIRSPQVAPAPPPSATAAPPLNSR